MPASKALKSVLLILGGLASIAAVIGVIIAIRSFSKEKHREQYTEIKCQSAIKNAQRYAEIDSFDICIDELNEARKHCQDDTLIERLAQEAKTFAAALEYDQIKIVKDDSIVKSTEVYVNRILIGLGEQAQEKQLQGDRVRLLSLQGILEDLSDRPGKAIDQYSAASKSPECKLPEGRHCANIHNYWGYTMFKWRLGGSAWASEALHKFNESIIINEKYPWPHINSAAVILTQAQEALEKKDFQAIKEHLGKARGFLETSEKLLPNNPRVHILLGHYYTLQGKRNHDPSLLEERQENFIKAIKHFKEARTQKTKNADASLYLGIVYDNVGKNDEALYEYGNAVSLDNKNIIASIKLAQSLQKQSKRESKEGRSADAKVTRDKARREIERCQELIIEFKANFTKRRNDTADSEAREWLSERLKEYGVLEKCLNDFNRCSGDGA